MRLGIKGKQVFGVTTIVGLVVVVLSLMHLARLAQVRLDESRARAQLLANAIFHRARAVVSEGVDPYRALARDSGVRSILESSLYSDNVTYAAIVDARGVVVAHADPSQEGQPLPATADLVELTSRQALAQLRSVYQGGGRNVELSQPLLLGGATFGSIRIGVSTLLVRGDLDTALRPAAITALTALGISVLGAMLLAQILLRPIHVIRSGLTRLGRGERGVQLDLNQQDEFGELGAFFNTMSAQLSADRAQTAGPASPLESAVEHLEDAVAIVGPSGHLLFANPAMRSLVPGAATGASLEALLAPTHPLREQWVETMANRQSRGPMPVQIAATGGEPGERLLLTHPVNDAGGHLVGVMIIVRNLEYLSQVQSTVRYSRKLAALGRLSAGIAHEVKNPLNAMMIHLELLRQMVAPAPAGARRGGGAVVATADGDGRPTGLPDALPHVDVIAAEIRRLDDVVQGFLKFTRPEELQLRPVAVKVLLDEVVPIVRPEAERCKVNLAIDCDGALAVNGDPALLHQVFLNLALNACQAMPTGGTLRIAARQASRHRISIVVEDTGTGIKPEHLNKVFDLYFTTKPKGSGIGLSMVYRIVQMHDGEIEIKSTPGQGTTFTIVLPQAS